MAAVVKVIRSLYRDSVSLMQLSARLAALPGVRQASAVMASENNLELLRAAGLLVANNAEGAGPSDLLIALEGEETGKLETALEEAVAALVSKPAPSAGGARRAEPARSLVMGLDAAPSANLALISTPGDYAAAEAEKALRLGLNVMIFSDNVSEADEIALKRLARTHDLLVMGPDCGTAIVDGVPLCFANVVKRGSVGVVGASGTGVQQVTCLVDRWGEGISQAIGTGGRDLHADVGGLSMLQGIKLLAADAETRVILLVSKPPSPEVAKHVLDAAAASRKPTVVNFLGADAAKIARPGLYPVRTLEDAARAAVDLARGRKVGTAAPATLPAFEPFAFAPGQRYLRGLYSGGTFCYEASLLLSETLSSVFTNTPVGKAAALGDVWKSRAHTLVDLGDDVFTRGRPHPMIDHRLRNERILREAEDPEVAVLLLDAVLGYGSHADPAGAMAPAIRDAIARAKAAGRALAVVGFVCGTEGDPQGLARQEQILREAGMLLAESNAQAVRLAASIAGAVATTAPASRVGGMA
jgi:succinyl-CoA synthetase alpha subunit